MHHVILRGAHSAALPRGALATMDETETTLKTPLASLQLLEALRNDDRHTIDALLQRTDLRVPRPYLESPLHLAVLCADAQTIDHLVRQHGIDPNMPTSDTGNTPLHVAVSSDRLDAATLLLNYPTVDETRANAAGKTPQELVKSPDMMQLLQSSRMTLRGQLVDALEDFEKESERGVQEGPAYAKLLALVQLPRVNNVDLSSASRASSNDVLHAAVVAKSPGLITAAIRRGADPYAQDIHGRTADSMTQDPSIRSLLRQLTNIQADQASAASPTYRGFLGKWTNMVHGYKVRWFVLRDGVLSYYHNPEDEGRHARGSIYLRYAKIITHQNERNRFEIVSQMGKGMNKLWLRGSDVAEAAGWIQILDKAKRFHEQSEQGTNEPIDRTRSPALSLNTSVGGAAAGRTALLSPGSASAGHDESHDVPDDHSEIGSLDGHEQGIPYAKEFIVVNNMLTTHFDVDARLLDQLAQSAAPAVQTIPSDIPGLAKPIGAMSLSTQPGDQRATIDALRKSAQDRVRLWQEFSKMVHEREHYLKEQLEREAATRKLWEEQMTHLGTQHHELETNLHQAMNENSSRQVRGTDSNAGGGLTSNLGGGLASTLTAAVGSAAGVVGAAGTAATSLLKGSSTNADDDDEFFDSVDPSGEADTTDRQASNEHAAHIKVTSVDEPQAQASRGSAAGAAVGGGAAGAAVGGGAAAAAAGGASSGAPAGDAAPAQEEAAPAKEEPAKEAAQDAPAHDSDNASDPLAEPGFTPYEHIRQEMPISKDNRPSMSLWSILKNNIGKDLTKITFPVSFNEPTSMLQRMAEDMEFSECLDAAAIQPDSTLRIAYVAAFAASNYSSTIGRIAKPFNPLLGETFEYARPDRKYRYVSEQVSHHPPVSACFAESPTWEYMGSVDAKSKFLGRTFEIRPTGVAHVRLKVDPSWIPSAKRGAVAKVPTDDSKVLEHYSWNKVTTSVGGFIVGSPTIDHYGDMTVVNHATGDKCVLTFMQRGWRGADAHEIHGKVTNAQGQVAWEVAGRWNSQLVARRPGGGKLGADTKAPAKDPVSSSRSNDTVRLLWHNSPKPPTPFNLTPFAITLNSLPDDLRPWLPPTDCRLRPDLTAFETGKFDKADELKVYLERLQRETRQKRDTGELPTHKPRWFERTTDPDSNAQFWKPVQGKGAHGRPEMEYWVDRAEVGTKRAHGEDATWPGATPIFGEYSKS